MHLERARPGFPTKSPKSGSNNAARSELIPFLTPRASLRISSQRGSALGISRDFGIRQSQSAPPSVGRYSHVWDGDQNKPDVGAFGNRLESRARNSKVLAVDHEDEGLSAPTTATAQRLKLREADARLRSRRSVKNDSQRNIERCCSPSRESATEARIPRGGAEIQAAGSGVRLSGPLTVRPYLELQNARGAPSKRPRIRMIISRLRMGGGPSSVKAPGMITANSTLQIIHAARRDRSYELEAKFSLTKIVRFERRETARGPTTRRVADFVREHRSSKEEIRSSRFESRVPGAH